MFAGAVVRTALTVTAAYLGLLTAAAGSASRRAGPLAPRAPSHRYDVIVPAHDEQRLIAATVGSLRNVDYPPERVRVHVIADNCTDATAPVAHQSGAIVHERDDPARPGKGPALEWAIDRLRAAGQLGDIVVFVDADTTVDPAFLRGIDRQLAAGATVVQGHYAVRSEGASAVVGFRAAAMAARTYLRPLGRTAIGGSAGLHGNGMAFRAEVLGERRWSEHLTEDVELYLELLMAGTRVAFAPDAMVEAEMPDTLASATSQNERWERGRLDLARRFVPALLRRSITGGPAGRIAYLDAAIDQLIPPLSVVVSGAIGWGALAGARSLLFGGRRAATDVILASATVAVVAAHVVVSLRLTKAPRSTYRALLLAPRMVVWKLALWLRVLRSPQRTAWTRTTRN